MTCISIASEYIAQSKYTDKEALHTVRYSLDLLSYHGRKRPCTAQNGLGLFSSVGKSSCLRDVAGFILSRWTYPCYLTPSCAARDP